MDGLNDIDTMIACAFSRVALPFQDPSGTTIVRDWESQADGKVDVDISEPLRSVDGDSLHRDGAV